MGHKERKKERQKDYHFWMCEYLYITEITFITIQQLLVYLQLAKCSINLKGKV